MSDTNTIDPVTIIHEDVADMGHSMDVCRKSYIEGARAALTSIEAIMEQKASVLEVGAIAIKTVMEDVKVLRDSLPSEDGGAVHDSEDNNNEYNNEGDN